MSLNLLIVENEESQIKLLRDAIEIYNKGKTVQIVLDEALSLDQGLVKLRTKSYDGAIVDLRLEPNDTVGLGNEIIKEIKSKLRFPVRIVSGHLGDLDPDLREENYLFKCKNRGDEEYDVILSEFSDIFSTGIIGILNNKGLIETNINTIFWKHISETLPEFVKQKLSDPDWDGERVLLRYISSHILEYLEINIDNNLEPYHKIEFYIKPPIKERIFTGDIIISQATLGRGVILTPACDLATDKHRSAPKAKHVTVAKIYPMDEVENGRTSEQIKELNKNNLDLKYHFLPTTSLYRGGYINFQHLFTIPLSTIVDNSQYKVECVITNPFRKDIISRFANYYSRQGQPAIN